MDPVTTQENEVGTGKKYSLYRGEGPRFQISSISRLIYQPNVRLRSRLLHDNLWRLYGRLHMVQSSGLPTLE